MPSQALTAVFLTGLVCLSGCTSSSTGGGSASPAAGGTLTLGIWQEPAGFLDAGVVANLPFSYVIDAPVQEGLLWYRSVQETAASTSPADYWAPDLATEVPTTANGDVRTAGCANSKAAMCVTWKLRAGVQWHDGSAFTSHDVCDTYQMRWLKYGLAGKPNPTALASTAGWDQVIGCTEVSQSVAVVDFKSQYGPYLALGSGVYGVVPASLLDPALAEGVSLEAMSRAVDLRRGTGNAQAFSGSGTAAQVLDGTGPFVLAAYTPGDGVVLVPNQHYWNKAALPHLGKLVFRIEAGVATATSDVASGAVQVGFDLGLSNLGALLGAAAANDPVLTAQTVAASGAEKLDFNLCAGDGGLCANPAAGSSNYTADPVVRRAFLLAIDRAAIVKAVAAGRTVVPRDAWMYLGAAYLAGASVAQTAFSTSAANALLDQSGYARDPNCGAAPRGGFYRHWKDGSCIVINLGTSSDSAVRLKEEAMVQADLAAAGIKIPTPFTPNAPASAFFGAFDRGGPLYTHAFDTAIYGLGMSIPGEPDSLSSAYHGDCGGTCPDESGVPSSGNQGAGANVSGVSDPALDMALDQGRASVDIATRKQAYLQVQQRLAATLPEIPLYQQLVVNAASVRLHGQRQNDLVWDYNIADWYCTNGQCS
jgi:peptide/nickel transport system substrate-binding protein